ncbi:class I adenylate-forming enzyme family protein [Streptomyces sp. NPDC002623]
MTPRHPRLDRIDAYTAHGAVTHPQRPALVSEDGSQLTYSQLSAQVDSWARALLHAGVAPGDRVAALGNSRTDVLVTFLAASGIGAVWLGLNPKYTLDELRYVVGDAEPVLLLGLTEDPDQWEKLRSLEAGAESVRALVEPGNPGFLAAGDEIPYEQLAEVRAAVRRDEPAALVYTSGSTGAPKGALITHAGLIDCALVMDEQWNTDTPPRVHNAFPINHVAWLGDVACSVLVAGGTVYPAEQYNPGAMLRTVAEHRLTHIVGVPTMLLYAIQTPEWSTCDLTSVERIVFSGAAAPAELVRTLRQVAPVSTCFGMTETTGSVTYSQAGDTAETLATTIGRPVPEFEIRVVTEDGKDAAEDEPGELRVRSHTNFAGYLGRPEATREAFDEQGFLRTGDQAVRLADGNLRLVGRLREMFKSGGYNVYPREIEEALEAHPEVVQAAVVGVADPVYGEVGVGYVVGDVDLDQLREFAAGRLANYKVPKRLRHLDDLPRLPVGKVDKLTLGRWAADERAAETADG